MHHHALPFLPENMTVAMKKKGKGTHNNQPVLVKKSTIEFDAMDMTACHCGGSQLANVSIAFIIMHGHVHLKIYMQKKKKGQNGTQQSKNIDISHDIGT